MAKAQIITLVGGIAANSINKKLFEFFKEEAADKLELDFFDIARLPYYSQDLESDPPAPVPDFKSRVQAADGALFITPEYNRSFPGVLKNAIDWATRPAGQNLWAGKPAGLIGTSPGAIGTFGAQNQLKQVLSFLDLRLMNQPEFYFAFPKELPGGKLPEFNAAFLRKYIDAFAVWVGSRV
jgi:chromate reductase